MNNDKPHSDASTMEPASTVATENEERSLVDAENETREALVDYQDGIPNFNITEEDFMENPRWKILQPYKATTIFNDERKI
jgi:hypothetical protein